MSISRVLLLGPCARATAPLTSERTEPRSGGGPPEREYHTTYELRFPCNEDLATRSFTTEFFSNAWAYRVTWLANDVAVMGLQVNDDGDVEVTETPFDLYRWGFESQGDGTYRIMNENTNRTYDLPFVADTEFPDSELGIIGAAGPANFWTFEYARDRLTHSTYRDRSGDRLQGPGWYHIRNQMYPGSYLSGLSFGALHPTPEFQFPTHYAFSRIEPRL